MERKSLLKKLIVFMLIMSFIALAFMFLNTYLSERNKTYIDVDNMKLIQLDEPKDGDTVAVIDTSLGEVRAVLYPDEAPQAVKNFTELAESGYYDNTYVFHSEEGVYAAAGAKLKDGTMPDGYDTQRELVERELSQNLWPFKGALIVLNTTAEGGFFDKLLGDVTYYNGSRFALLNSIEFTDEIISGLRESSESRILADAFIENGGVPNFSQQMTVIGQTYQGFDVIEKLSSLETESSGNDTYKIPKEDVMIKSVTIEKYSDEG